jgi:hypothetical protein
MTYNPTDAERNCAAGVQIASALLFFVPGLIIRHTRWGRSPYIRLWAKANAVWSTYTILLTVIMYGCGVLLNTQALALAVWLIHAVMVILAAFASMFNRPVGYATVVDKHCSREMTAVYGAATAGADQDADEES